MKTPLDKGLKTLNLAIFSQSCSSAVTMAVICRRSAAAAAGFLARRMASSQALRPFGSSAAAVELDYDSDWEEDYRLSNRSPPPLAFAAAAKCVEMEESGVQWVFMGSPGVQKHLYASRVAQLLDVPYISMGTLVRQELHPLSSLYIKIANAVNEGKLVPEDVIFGLLSKRLEEGYCRGERGFVLDGIPRTCIQAEILDQIAIIDLVVNLKSREDCLVKKHLGNDICAHCGHSFDTYNSESNSLNPCLATRSHSNINTSCNMDQNRLEKLRMYAEQNKQLEEYYRKQNKLLDFHVAGAPGETWQGLLAALRLQQLDPKSTSQKIEGMI